MHGGIIRGGLLLVLNWGVLLLDSLPDAALLSVRVESAVNGGLGEP